MGRFMLGDKMRNEEIRKRTGAEDVIEYIAKRKWKWTRDVAKTNDNGWTKRILKWRPRVDKRNPRRETSQTI